MKVYRGYNNEVGPISYAHWIYVTPDIEQAKWYATKDGEVEDGDIIEYDLDVEHLRFLSLSKLNSLAQDENEIYTAEDLLWYQEGLGESLYKYVAGIVFEDPHSKRDHTIYIVFSQDHLKNGRVLTKKEFEKIELRESDNNEYLDEPETPPEIGCEKVYYRGIHKFVIEHMQDDEDMGGEEYFHIYNYEKSEEDSDWYEIDDTAKYSWEDCLYYMNDFGKPQTSFTEPPDEDGSKYLDEELIYAERDADGNLENEVFKNPSKAEIRKNYLSQTRVVIDGEGNFYFCMAGNLIHDDIIEKIGKGENYSLFYDYYKDTFYKRDEYRNKEEHEKMNKRLKEWLLTYPYIKENFGIDFNAYVFMNIEEPFDIKWDRLNESVIKRDDGEVGGYYTQSTNEMINIINNKYPENDVRVLYDIDRNLYIFADTYSAIHFNLILYMILFTNVYDNISEIKDNKYENDEVLQDIIKSKLYLASFKIFRNYTNDSDEEFINFLRNIPENATDGYDYGYVCKINDKLWAICRDDEIGEAKQVPLLQNKTWINLKDNTQINESVNLKNLNRLAGFYHYNSGNWEMLPRTEKQLDSVDDYEEYKNYCHDYTVEDLFEEDMIRFHIEDIGNVVCTIESPYQYWIKPFIRKLYTKFPEEMAMVKKFEIEYYKENGSREYRSLEV